MFRLWRQLWLIKNLSLALKLNRHVGCVLLRPRSASPDCLLLVCLQGWKTWWWTQTCFCHAILWSQELAGSSCLVWSHPKERLEDFCKFLECAEEFFAYQKCLVWEWADEIGIDKGKSKHRYIFVSKFLGCWKAEIRPYQEVLILSGQLEISKALKLFV